MYVRSTCVPSVQGDQKKTLAPLELELQMVVNLHVDAESWI